MIGLDDYRIEAVQPPALTEMNVAVRNPDYLRGEGSGEIDMETTYQSGLRLREGSDVTLVATSSVPLGETDVELKTDAGVDPQVKLVYSDDRRQVQLTLADFDAATTINLVPRDTDGISAQAPYRYFLGVVLDEPPELQIRLRGIGSAVTPIARIPVEAIATDDYGVEQLLISVSPADEVDSQSASVSPELNRDGEAETELDLRDLVADEKLPELKPGGAINLIGEATDRYDLGSQHVDSKRGFSVAGRRPGRVIGIDGASRVGAASEVGTDDR